MTSNSVADTFPEDAEIIRFGKNRFAERARDIASLRRFLDHENKFAHSLMTGTE